MWAHYDHVGRVQSAVIRGDLKRAHAAAGWIAEHETVEGLPRGSERFVEEMRAHAREVVQADDLAAAAVATGNMGRTCGDCHRFAEGGPRFAVADVPRATDSVATRMVQHLVAADYLWDGLIGPSDRMWGAGAAILAEPATYQDEFARYTEVYAAAAELANTLHELGERAVGTSDPRARGALYGAVIGTCAACHDLIARERDREKAPA